ncbi:hypothetical protein V5799_031806 [Amblyomma americanum]|uniref:Integrase catalytic domain-containing protein n=1 Tax=Amblyomma americanum TaxID=6943 RepID=A0AAQ4DSZ5_AMBAM
MTVALLHQILRHSHTDHRKTTSYHPQRNGLTERLNKTLGDMLSMYVVVQHRTWDDVLPYVIFAYNTAVEETTNIPPFRVVYGRDMTTMLDVMLPHVDDIDPNADLHTILHFAEEARQLERVRILNQQCRDAQHYNLRRRDVQYTSGDRVRFWFPIRRRGFSEKFLCRYFGSY